jgi:hypothetical protein
MLSTKVASIPTGEVPAGTILAYVGQLNVLPPEWYLCDGSTVHDDESPFDGQAIPNLTDNRFLMGVDSTSGSGVSGGRNDIPTDGAHSHGGATGTLAHSDTQSIDNSSNYLQATGTGHTHTISVDGAHSHGSENRPAFLTVHFILKIK